MKTSTYPTQLGEYKKISQAWPELIRSLKRRMHRRAPVIQLHMGCYYCLVDNEKDHRVFAHTRHFPNVVCLHPKIESLPMENLRGILAHEIGHIMAGALYDDWSEEAADTFCIEHLRWPLEYDMVGDMWLQKLRKMK